MIHEREAGVQGGAYHFPFVLLLDDGQLCNLLVIKTLNSDQMIYQLQNKLLFRIQFSVIGTSFRNMFLEILSVLEEAKKEYGDDRILETQTLWGLIDMGHKVHQVAVVSIFIDSLLLNIHWLVKIYEDAQHLLVLQEVLQGFLGDGPQGEEVTKHLLPLQGD